MGASGGCTKHEVLLGDRSLSDPRKSPISCGKGVSRRRAGLHEYAAKLGAILQGTVAREKFYLLGMVLRYHEAHQGALEESVGGRLHSWIHPKEASGRNIGGLCARHLFDAIFRF